MLINFSIISENLARTFGPLEAIFNVERQRRYTFAEYHLLTNRIANVLRDDLGLGKGDRYLLILENDNLALLRKRQLSAVLNHDLHHDLHLACHLLMQHHGAAPSAAAPTRSNVEVITPFNLPANLSR